MHERNADISRPAKGGMIFFWKKFLRALVGIRVLFKQQLSKASMDGIEMGMT